MYAQCPECQSVFSLDAATLAQAHGCVGCGHCGVTFDTMATLTDSLPAGPFEQLELNHPSPEPPVLMQRVDASVVDDEPAASTEPEELGQTEPNDVAPSQVVAPTDDVDPGDSPADEVIPADEDILTAEDPVRVKDDAPWAAWSDNPEVVVQVESAREEDAAQADPDEQALSTLDRELAELELAEQSPGEDDTDSAETEPGTPSFAQQRQRPMGRRMHSRLVAACVALAVVLALQLGYAERTSLIRTAFGGALVRAVCGDLGCLGPFQDLDEISLLSRDVRRHPSVEDALIISATLHNAAEFTQPYPVVVITLSDLDDNRVAMRRFRPVEYLPDPELRQAGLAPGSSTALVFEVRDPGRNAVAFEFSFL